MTLLLIATIFLHWAVAEPTPIPAPPASAVSLWRLDCGLFKNVPIDVLATDGRYKGQRRDLADSCYLVRHGADYLLWDSGYPSSKHETGAGYVITGPTQSLVAQLARIGVRPEQVRYVALSHWHDDHIGGAPDFPKATLIIGRPDWQTLRHPPKDLDTTPLKPWLTGRSPVTAVSGDRDIFGDGSVMMIATPGHTRGHHSLVVRLRNLGVVMLTGDLCHIRPNCEHEIVPQQAEDRSKAFASIRRFNAIARHWKATAIVGHESGDVDKLPAFPAAAS